MTDGQAYWDGYWRSAFVRAGRSVEHIQNRGLRPSTIISAIRRCAKRARTVEAANRLAVLHAALDESRRDAGVTW